MLYLACMLLEYKRFNDRDLGHSESNHITYKGEV